MALVRPMRVWRILVMLAIVSAAIALDGGESRAQPAVTAVATDTEITLSWEVSGSVVFYWHKASESKVNLEAVRSGKSHTISGLTPETRYRFFFYQGTIGELFVTTLATNPDPQPTPAPTPDPPPAEEPEQSAEDPTPSQDYSEIVAGCVSDDLLEKVRRYYDANKNRSPGYGANWKRVLVAFDDVDDGQLTAMTAADARTRESRWFGWQPVRKALDCIETKSAPPPQQPKLPAVISEISISAGPDVVEGDILTFTVTATPAPTAPLDVKVTVTTTGNYAVPATTYTATISTNGSWLMKLSSYADSIDEPDGTVTATIDQGSTYTISSAAGSASLAVQDDDDPPLPQVGITSGNMSIIEGDDVTLTITSTPAPATELTVPLGIVATGDFGVTSGTETVTIPTTGSVTHTISTFDDFTDEDDGTLSITVGDGTGYDVSLSDSFRYIEIADDDLTFAAQQARAQRAPSAMPQQSTPTVTITPSTSTVSEGTPVALTITTTGTIPTDGLPVTLKVGTNTYGQHRANLTSTSPVTTVSNINVRGALLGPQAWFIWKRVNVTQSPTMLTFTPTNTPYHDADTTLTFQLEVSSHYMRGTNQKATITVSDRGMTSASYKTCFPNGGPVSSSWVNTFTRTDGDDVGPLLGKRVLVVLGETVKNPPPPMTVHEATEIRDRFTKTFRKAGYVYGRDIEYDWWDSTVKTLTMLEECARTGKGAGTAMKPVVSIVASQDTIEGSSNQFTITAVPAPASGESITVNLSVTPDNVTIKSAPTDVMIDSTGVAKLNLDFMALTDSNTTGSATVTLTDEADGTPPTYMVTSDHHNSATISVRGNSMSAAAVLYLIPVVNFTARVVGNSCDLRVTSTFAPMLRKKILINFSPFSGTLESVRSRGTKSYYAFYGSSSKEMGFGSARGYEYVALLGGYGYTFMADSNPESRSDKNTKTKAISGSGCP